ncbi:hypothetical protein AB0I89_24040 [Micromonospora sp. NPDC049801]|uniref:hypothetical protein n=1 Tax=unclassified Micromonospora TaxID=2617518 RepID=UPI003402DB5D
MTETPAILADLPIHWSGVDATTPDGCTLATTVYLGIPTTYVIRAGQVIGRSEISDGRQAGYAGDRLKGGYLIGFGDSQSLGERIAAHTP